MASAAMVHFGLDPGKFVRWMGGEYTGYYRDVKATLLAVRPYITAEDYNHIERILLDGCPAELKLTEPLSNKLEMIRRGNSKSFNDHPELVKKAMNKEDRYSHLVLVMKQRSPRQPFCNIQHCVYDSNAFMSIF
jgi:hypothetical protein